MLKGLLEDFVNTLNEHLEPLKDQTQNLDRLSMLFLVIGFIGSLILASVFGYLLGLYVSGIIMGIFVVILAMLFYRNNREIQTLHKSIMLNMAIIVYLEN